MGGGHGGQLTSLGGKEDLERWGGATGVVRAPMQ